MDEIERLRYENERLRDLLNGPGNALDRIAETLERLLKLTEMSL